MVGWFLSRTSATLSTVKTTILVLLNHISHEHRLTAFFSQYLYEKIGVRARQAIERETGANAGPKISEFFKDNDIQDVLDSITLIYKVTIKKYL